MDKQNDAAGSNESRSIRRRGLIAAAWTAVAAFVLKRTTARVSAGVDGDVVVGATNVTTANVFLTGYDDFELRVSEQRADGFRVRARDESAAGRFSWRVVAKRKDIAGARLEPVTVPAEPKLPEPLPVPPPVPPTVTRRPRP